MSRQQRPAISGEGPLRSHHIDAIAHHFLSDDGGPRPGDTCVDCHDVAVATPGAGRAAACTAAGLAAAAPGGPDRWGRCLLEDVDVAWSAFSYLGGPDFAELPAAARADLPAGLRARWLNAAPHGATPSSWLRWRLLGEASAATLPAWEVVAGMPAAARAAPVRWAALVWCVVADEAAASGSAASLGRLVALLRPASVDILVVPDGWDARPGAWRPGGRRGDPGWRNQAHLQEIARAAVGPVPTRVRVFPVAPSAAAEAGAALLVEIAADITASVASSDTW
jgi:hypothetical protein